jgi:hypothetical protein
MIAVNIGPDPVFYSASLAVCCKYMWRIGEDFFEKLLLIITVKLSHMSQIHSKILNSYYQCPVSIILSTRLVVSWQAFHQVRSEGTKYYDSQLILWDIICCMHRDASMDAEESSLA